MKGRLELLLDSRKPCAKNSTLLQCLVPAAMDGVVHKVMGRKSPLVEERRTEEEEEEEEESRRLTAAVLLPSAVSWGP